MSTYPMHKKSRELLHLLKATNGGVVTYELIEYQLWGRHQKPSPKCGFNFYFSYLRDNTGYVIRHYQGVGYALPPSELIRISG